MGTKRCNPSNAGRSLSTDRLKTRRLQPLYRDEGGRILYRVVRGPIKNGKKTFGQNPPDVNGGWVKGKGAMDGVRRVLFRLPELLAADPSRPVFVVEGEKDVFRLAAVGLVGTTNPGGAGKWGKCQEQGDGVFSEPLRGRDVVILPDNDLPGRRHAADVAQRLSDIAASIRIVELPDLPEHGDVSDWLSNGGSAGKLKEPAESAPMWSPGEAEGEGGGSQGHTSQAKKIVELALEAGIELFHDQRNDPFVVIEENAGRRILAVGSKDFGYWLRGLAWRELESAPSGEVITTARHTLASIARFEGPRHELHVRCA